MQYQDKLDRYKERSILNFKKISVISKYMSQCVQLYRGVTVHNF